MGEYWDLFLNWLNLNNQPAIAPRIAPRAEDRYANSVRLYEDDPYKVKPKLSAFKQALSGSNKKYIDDAVMFYLSRGVDPMLISGIFGNISKESMWNPGADARDNNLGDYYGLVLMDLNMRKEVARVYGKINANTTHQFIYDAMSGNKKISPEWRNYMTQKGGFWNRKFNDAGSSAMAFGRVFERPNEKLADWAERMRSAQDAYDYIIQNYQLNSNYDYIRANQLGYTPDETGHWPTRDVETGLYLKSATHPTVTKSIIADNAEGYNLIYDKPSGRLGSRTWMKPLPALEPVEYEYPILLTTNK